MGKTLIAYIGNMPRTQREVIRCLISQIYENTDCDVVDFMENNLFGFSIPDGYKLVKPKQWQSSNWRQMCDRYKVFIQPYDSVVVIGTPLFIGDKPLTLKLLKRISVQITKNPKTFISNPVYKSLLERLVFVRACIGKNTIQYCLDSREVDFSKVWKLKRYTRVGPSYYNDISYFPMFEWSMQCVYQQDIPKAQDIFFVGTALTQEKRNLISRFVKASENKFDRKITYSIPQAIKRPLSGVIGICGEEDPIDVMSQQEYLYNLMLSRYTIILPPYNSDCFNMVRFIEAIVCNCIPLVLQHDNLKWLKQTFPDMYDIIESNNLIIRKTKTKIPEEWVWSRIRLQEQDGDIINELKSTTSFKNIIDKKYIKERLTHLLDG